MTNTTTPRIGELFAGYGGLGMGVQAVLGGEVAWFSEFDPAPSKILAHHWPDVPNHGDITKIDWATVEPVDILTGGFPCQDVSLAGARAGIREGTRSGLWSEFARAIEALQPRLVVIENVRGLLSASAGGPMESDPWGMGDGAARPVVNALGAVLGDLADLGYDAEWCGVRAADAGAPHGRFRVFIVAYRSGLGWGEGWPESARREGRPAAEFRGSVLADAAGIQRSIGHRDDVQAGRGALGRIEEAGRSSFQDADLAAVGERGEPAPNETESGRSRADAGRRSGAPTTDTSCHESERWGIGGDMGGASYSDEGASEERQRVRDTTGDRGSVVADTSGIGGNESNNVAGFSGEGAYRAGVVDEHSPRPGGTEWGVYLPAIRRWESVTGRIAPPPTNPDGRDGSHRLSAQFVEWMMGLPDGHVTDPAIGLTRNEQLKALGNGVVPQQATLALRYLLSRQEVAA